jgi:hypothetical protein
LESSAEIEMAFLKLREWREWKAEVVGGGEAKKVVVVVKVEELMRAGGDLFGEQCGGREGVR